MITIRVDTRHRRDRAANEEVEFVWEQWKLIGLPSGAGSQSQEALSGGPSIRSLLIPQFAAESVQRHDLS
jgi:hypothetical protein